MRGDLLAQYAANNVAERRLTDIASRYGPDLVKRYLDEMLNYSERRMRAALKQIPVGIYEFEDVMEGDGITDNPITIRVRIESKGDAFVADFTASDDACKGPLNCRWPSVAACVYYVLKACLDPELPPNAGAYRPIDVRVRGRAASCRPRIRRLCATPTSLPLSGSPTFCSAHSRPSFPKGCWRPARAR